MLSSSLSEGQRVCPGDAISFTCVTNGSASLAWSSDDYIGQGGVQLEFASYHDPGRIARNRASPIGTQAILVSKEIEENETQGILESQLNVMVISDYQIATIKCLHVDTGSQETTRFQLLGMACELYYTEFLCSVYIIIIIYIKSIYSCLYVS